MHLTLSHLSSPWHSFSSLKPYPILESDVSITAVVRSGQICVSFFEALSFIRAGSRCHGPWGNFPDT